MDDTKFNECVNTVAKWFEGASECEKKSFINTPREHLIRYHHSLGPNIRNKFELWKNEWVPVIVDGVDISPNHPDAISMKIIEAVWDRVTSSRG